MYRITPRGKDNGVHENEFIHSLKPLRVESNKNQHARGQSRDPMSKLRQDKEGTGVSGG